MTASAFTIDIFQHGIIDFQYVINQMFDGEPTIKYQSKEHLPPDVMCSQIGGELKKVLSAQFAAKYSTTGAWHPRYAGLFIAHGGPNHTYEVKIYEHGKEDYQYTLWGDGHLRYTSPQHLSADAMCDGLGPNIAILVAAQEARSRE